MESLRRWIKFLLQDVSWHLAILLLPWQIRWFSEGPMVNGYPWEQGRISIYASWIPMLATMAATLILFPSRSEAKSKDGLWNKKRSWLLLTGLILLLIPSVFTISSRATAQWWIQWLILIGFAWSLLVRSISWRSIATWFLVSLLPHLFLGLQQYLVQFVHGSKWLGIATQNPLDKGVSIVQVGDQRILRVYGGFPHPNIFGGWIVMGMVAALSLWNEAKKYTQYFLAMFLALSSIVLILTFSRSALIACMLGVIVFGVCVILAHARIQRKQVLIPIFIVLFSLACTAFIVRDKIFVRLQPTQTRLEVKSVNERQEAIKNGWELFKQHPWKGSGPGTTILALSRLPNNDSKIPSVPPHIVPLMVLDELGLFGLIGLLLITITFVRIRYLRCDILFLLPLFLLDHFLWSLWSGCTLLLVTIFLLNRCTNKVVDT